MPLFILPGCGDWYLDRFFCVSPVVLLCHMVRMFACDSPACDVTLYKRVRFFFCFFLITNSLVTCGFNAQTYIMHRRRHQTNREAQTGTQTLN